MTRRELIAVMAAAGDAFTVRRGDAMQGLEKIKILFIAGFGLVDRRQLSESLFLKALMKVSPMMRRGKVDICHPTMVRYSVIYRVTG